ncbi:hypothetical protein D3C74_469910 [compost metagenome]
MLTQSRDKVIQLHFHKATDSLVDLIEVILRDRDFTDLKVWRQRKVDILVSFRKLKIQFPLNLLENGI